VSPCPDAVGGGTPVPGYRQWPPGPPRERLRTRRWGHYCDLASINLVASSARLCALQESCPASTIHRISRCLITSQRFTDSWPPHTVVHLVTRATLGIVAAGVNGIFTTSAVPEKPGHASALCAHVSSTSASLRARVTVQIPPFHTFVCYPPSLTGGPGPSCHGLGG